MHCAAGAALSRRLLATLDRRSRLNDQMALAVVGSHHGFGGDAAEASTLFHMQMPQPMPRNSQARCVQVLLTFHTC